MSKIPKNRGRNLIDKHYSFLVENINARHLYDVLYERGTITEDEMEKIQAAKTTRHANTLVLRYVQHRDPNLTSFTAALRRGGYGYVIEQMIMSINEDQPKQSLDNECQDNQVTVCDDYPKCFKGKLDFVAKEFRSNNNYRYRWLYFYLQHIEKTLKVVLFDEAIDLYNDLEENQIYDLNNLNFEKPRVKVYHNDVRQTFPLTGKIGPGDQSFIRKCRSLETIHVQIPDLKYQEIKEAKILSEDCEVNIKAFVCKIMGMEETSRGNRSTQTLPIIIADDTGKMIVRIFGIDTDDNNQRYLKKQIQIDYGIIKMNVQKGYTEVHVSRYTRIRLEDPGTNIPYFSDNEEEEEAGDKHIEDLFQQDAGTSVIARTKAFVLAIRRLKSPLIVPVHKKCKGQIETLPNGRINCTKCDRFLPFEKISLVYDMRAKIGRRKPFVAEKWMSVNQKSAKEIMGLSAKKFNQCSEEEQDKMIQNVKSISFEFKILKKRKSNPPGDYIYSVIDASCDVDESSEDDDSDQ